MPLTRKIRSRVLLGTSLALLAVGLVVTVIVLRHQAATFRIAVGPADGEEAKMAAIIQQALMQTGAEVRLTPISTSGQADTLAALQRNEVDLAITRSNDGGGQGGGVVAVLRKNALLLIALAPRSEAKPKSGKTGAKASSGKIEKVGDLQGRKIGIVTGNQASPDLLAFVMRHYGLSPDKYATQMVALEDLRTAVNDRTVDALFLAAPLTHPSVTAAIAATAGSKEGATLLGIEGEAIEALHPGYESVEISKGTFGGGPDRPEEDLTTAAFSHFLLARPARLENTGYWETRIFELATAVYRARFAIARDARGILNIQAPPTEKDAKVQVHPGALAYLGDTHKNFFERYGDAIFYALLILPFLGSALAGALGFFRRDAKRHRMKLTEHLLNILDRIRQAETAESIDHLQHEIDKIVRASFQLGAQEMDEDTYEHFKLLIEQARFAISDRRVALANARTASIRSIAPARAEA